MSPRGTERTGQFDRRDVENALAIILASEQFAGSVQLSSFLTYIVTKKLDGKEEDIKAYSIAVDALGRDENFDPQENAFVRVAAGRLRQVLTLYYASAESSDYKVRIELEAGSYVPRFSVPDAAERVNADGALSPDADETIDNASNDAPAAAAIVPPQSTTVSETQQYSEPQRLTFASKWWRLVVAGIGLAVLANLALALYVVSRLPSSSNVQTEVALEKPAPMDIGVRPRVRAFLVLPDRPYPDWLKIGELIESLSVVIARFDDYQFVAAKVVDESDDIEADLSIDYQMILTAYRRDKNVRFFGKMVNVKSQSTIWSTEQSFGPPETMSGRNVPDIFGRIYSKVASPYGVLYANLIGTSNQRTELSCVISGYQYFYSKTSEKHAAARACAEKMVDRGTRLPSIHAMLTFLYLDEFRENRNRRDRDPLQAATRAAKRAVVLGPQSARAHQALFGAHKVQGQKELARSAADKAIALNPYDADIVGDYAAWLISIGDIEKGKEYLARVESMLDVRPAWLEFYRFLGAELSNQLEEANDISLSMDSARAPLLGVAVAIGAHSRGDTNSAQRALEELIRTAPGFRKDPMAQFINRGFDPKIAQQLVDKLKAAGLDTFSGG